MSSGKNSASNPAPSQPPKRPTLPASEMLTPSELESLKRKDKEVSDYARKAFADLRKKAPPAKD